MFNVRHRRATEIWKNRDEVEKSPVAPTFYRCTILLGCLVEADFEGFYINYLLDYS